MSGSARKAVQDAGETDLTVKIAAGVALRKANPRSSLAEHHVNERDIAHIVLAQEETRVPQLLELRHQRMQASPFAFYRGSANLMALDLQQNPSGPVQGQVCGDAHMANFGLFGSPDRRVVFDINDFDETYRPSPVEWDLKRLAVSLHLAAQQQGASKQQALLLVQECARAWRTEVQQLAQLPAIDLWYRRSSEEHILAWAQKQDATDKSAATAMAQSGLANARGRTGWTAIRKLTTPTATGRSFKSIPPLLTPMPEEGWELVHSMYQKYQESISPELAVLLEKYTVVDAAHKVVGVGSVGLLSIAVLLQGTTVNDLIVLQVKQAQRSVLDARKEPNEEHQGRRVVDGQRRLQATGDPFLGWTTGAAGRHYYVRQLRDMKWSPDLSLMTPQLLSSYATACARVLARGQCRGIDPAILSGWLGKGNIFDKAIGAHASAYAQQVHLDYAAFLEAIKGGALASGPGQDMSSWWEQGLRKAVK